MHTPRTRIWVSIGPYSWGGSFKEQAAKKSYLVEKVSEATELAKTDKYFFPYFDKIRAAGYKKMSFSYGFTETTSYRHGTASFDVPRTGSRVTGTCYPDAWRFLMQQGEGHLVHGSLQLSSEGARVNHAWFEFPSGVVWEPQTGQYFTVEDFKVFAPIEDERYSVHEAVMMLARAGKHGPWSTEEGREYLGR